MRGKKLLTYTSLQHLGKVTEKSCNLSEKRVDLHRGEGSGTSLAGFDELYQSNTYRKDLSSIHFDNAKGQRPYCF